MMGWVPREARRNLDRRSTRALTERAGVAGVSSLGARRGRGSIELGLTGRIESGQPDTVVKAAALRATAGMQGAVLHHDRQERAAAGSPRRTLGGKGEPNQANGRSVGPGLHLDPLRGPSRVRRAGAMRGPPGRSAAMRVPVLDPARVLGGRNLAGRSTVDGAASAEEAALAAEGVHNLPRKKETATTQLRTAEHRVNMQPMGCLYAEPDRKAD